MSFLKYWGMLSTVYMGICLLAPDGEISTIQFYAGLALCLFSAWLYRTQPHNSAGTGRVSKVMIALALMISPGYALYLGLSAPAVTGPGDFAAVTESADNAVVLSCAMSFAVLIFMIIYSVCNRVRER